MARNPPTCPAEKRSLGKNLDRWVDAMLCAGAVVHGSWKKSQFPFVVQFRLGSAGVPNICSPCYTMPYMKIPANNQVIFVIYIMIVMHNEICRCGYHNVSCDWFNMVETQLIMSWRVFSYLKPSRFWQNLYCTLFYVIWSITCICQHWFRLIPNRVMIKIIWKRKNMLWHVFSRIHAWIAQDWRAI